MIVSVSDDWSLVTGLILGILLYLYWRFKTGSRKSSNSAAHPTVKERIQTKKCDLRIGRFSFIRQSGQRKHLSFQCQTPDVVSLVLLHSKREDVGISTKLLSMTLWPGQGDGERPKNIRGRDDQPSAKDSKTSMALS